MDDRTRGKWNVGRPGGPDGPFWSLVTEHGTVVAMRIVREEDARFMAVAANELSEGIARMEHMAQQAQAAGDTSIYVQQVIDEARRLRFLLLRGEGDE